MDFFMLVAKLLLLCTSRQPLYERIRARLCLINNEEIGILIESFFIEYQK